MARPLPFTLDLEDFIGLSFTTGPDGKVYQLPDQQFANLYWFRHDWFQRPDLKAGFRKRHGYELGVPLNLEAYEDIADFFTHEVKELDGRRVYGHMDYAKVDPSLGWRFTDAWLAMAGVGDPGLPNGQPVDQWGIRVENCHPVGSSISRGGALNSPAAVYALRKYLEWLRQYAPPEAMKMDFSTAGPAPGRATSRSRFSGTPPSPPICCKRGYRWSTAMEPRMAGGAVAAWGVLGKGHETRLSGLWFLDAVEQHATATSSGCLVVCPVHDLQNRVAKKTLGSRRFG